MYWAKPSTMKLPLNSTPVAGCSSRMARTASISTIAMIATAPGFSALMNSETSSTTTAPAAMSSSG
jgi:hypothetical protein